MLSKWAMLYIVYANAITVCVVYYNKYLVNSVVVHHEYIASQQEAAPC